MKEYFNERTETMERETIEYKLVGNIISGAVLIIGLLITKPLWINFIPKNISLNIDSPQPNVESEVTDISETPITPEPKGSIFISIRDENNCIEEYEVKYIETTKSEIVHKYAYNDVDIRETTENELLYTFTTVDGKTMTKDVSDCEIRIEVR